MIEEAPQQPANLFPLAFTLAEDTLGHKWLVIDSKMVRTDEQTYQMARWLQGIIQQTLNQLREG